MQFHFKFVFYYIHFCTFDFYMITYRFNCYLFLILILIIVLLLFFLMEIFAGFIKGKLLNTFTLFLFFRKSNLFFAVNGFRKLRNYFIFINHKSSKSILFACKDIYLTIIFFNLFFF